MHVFVGDLEDLALDPDDDHHLRRALRVRRGEAVTASDGRGGWRLCAWTGDGLEATAGVVHDAAPTPAVTVGFALTKGDRPEWVTQKLTEAGVDVIVPFTAERSVVRWDDDKVVRQHERLTRVAREAAMQSRRVWLPTVRPVATFAEVVASIRGQAAVAHPGGGRPSLERPALLVGPEGGFSDAELASGLPAVGLGPTILRAETAAIAAGLALAWLRSGTLSVTD
ncbi:MAG: rRNA (uracil1498-N3)-methyltransferase [Actinomycetota bacterium]|nr:rRNA (uracil1498-N3)-methyltransferase [Actinomycetota bacterium]